MDAFLTGIRDSVFVRFIMVGIINTVFGYTVFALFIFLGFHYYVATALATIINIVFNFNTIGRIVFHYSNNWLLFRFFIVYFVIYLIYVGALKIFSTYDVSIYLAGAIIICPLAILSFILNKQFVFKEI